MKLIYAQEEIKEENKSIFLAGPTPRSNIVKSWRPKAIELFSDLGFAGTIFIPELRSGPSSEFEYDKQIDWEHTALEKADVILFWIPRNLVNMPGFTTNIELGYWLAKNPKKMIVGSPECASKMDYINFCCSKEGIQTANTLEDLVRKTLQKIYIM